MNKTVIEGFTGTDAGMAGDGGGDSFAGPGGAEAARVPLRELVDDRLLDALLGACNFRCVTSFELFP
jgi:hypothetical protein